MGERCMAWHCDGIKSGYTMLSSITNISPASGAEPKEKRFFFHLTVQCGKDDFSVYRQGQSCFCTFPRLLNTPNFSRQYGCFAVNKKFQNYACVWCLG